MCSSGKSAKRWWRRTAGDHHHLGWRFCWRDSDSPRARTNSHPSLYRYDSRGNCIARSLPGAGWTYTVYDKGNRPVLTQDAAQRAQNANAWTFAIPDRLGRPALRGTTTMTVNAFADPYKNTVVQASLPKTPTYSGTYRGYVLSGITLSSPVLLEVDYYDAYGFAGTSPFPAANNADFAYDSSIGTSFSAYYSPSAQGLQTGSLLKVLDNTAGNQYLWSVSYFDDKCRVVQHRASTHLGGVEKDWFLYDFTGNATKRKTQHKPSTGTALTETTSQTYNTWGRPVKTTHKLGSGTAQVVSNRTYDKAGRLATDKRNGTAALKTTFSYNIRSWVTGITGTLFTETLKYQNGTPARWGGDVSQAVWKDDRATQTKTYTFGYDTVGRLTTAAFSDAAGASINFSENVSAYDANGNITGLQRYGRTSASAYGLIDNLAYTYSGNKATSIKDTGAAAYSSDFRFSNGTNNTYSYSYDAAGRITADASKSISSITWNVLGLPQTVTFSSGAVINYSYAADGTKLREARTASSTTTTTDYTGNLVLENGTRSRLLFDGGYMSLSDNAYHYFLTDHLGSVRVVANTSGTAEEYDHYYPLGGPIAKYSTATSIQPVKFQGKEWGASKGLNLYDFGARRYDPASGRWLSQDPLAEKYYAHSPYLFCAANPMKYVDPTGEIITIIYTENGVKHTFRYSGIETNIPRNIYVQSVIEAYQYNKQNWKRAEFGGNSPTTDLVEQGNINVYLYEDTNGPSTYLMGNGGIPFIRWNPYEGLSCGQGVVLSPASVLAHEADHAIDDLTNSKAHSDRRGTIDLTFDNAEERRVITGSEQKTATANGEIRKGQVTRRNHEGKTVYTNGVTSSEIDQMTTDYYRKHYEKSY